MTNKTLDKNTVTQLHSTRYLEEIYSPFFKEAGHTFKLTTLQCESINSCITLTRIDQRTTKYLGLSNTHN